VEIGHENVCGMSVIGRESFKATSGKSRGQKELGGYRKRGNIYQQVMEEGKNITKIRYQKR